MENEKIGPATPQSDAPTEKNNAPETPVAPRPRRRTRSGRKPGQTADATPGGEPNSSDQTRPDADTASEQAGNNSRRNEDRAPEPAGNSSRRNEDRASEPAGNNSRRNGDNAPEPAGNSSRRNGDNASEQAAPAPRQKAGASDPTANAGRVSGGGSAKQNRSSRAGGNSRQGEKRSRKAPEAPAALDRTFRPLERAPRPQEQSRRAEKSAKPAAKTDAPKRANRWTRHDFILQLAVVILGVVVTFAGSGLVERWRQAREVRTVMQLVYEELKANRESLADICEEMAYDRQGMLHLIEHDMDYRRVPVDTLRKYQSILGRLREFAPRTDALDMLRTSGTITAVRDKALLLDILECYSWMTRFAEGTKGYTAQKSQSLNHLFASGVKRSLSSMQPEEWWQTLLADPMCAAFLSSMTSYFEKTIYDGSAVERIDRVMAALDEKYGFE